MKASDEQQAIIDSSERNLAVNAFAGSGKSTTLVHYAKKWNKLRKLYLCFNKSVQIEAEKKFREEGVDNIQISTAHSLAHQAIRPKGELVASFRLNDLLPMLGETKSSKNFKYYQHAVKLLAMYCNSAVKKIEDIDYAKEVSYKLDADEVILFAEKNYGKIVDRANKIWDAMSDGKIPFTHDYYLKKYQLTEPKLHLHYDLILFDEGQDANKGMADIFLKQDKCNKVVIGDIFQAIYGWRGAFDILSESGYPTYSITQSFRFPPNIAELANQILDVRRRFNPNTPPFQIKGTPIENLRPSNGKTVYLGRTNLAILQEAFKIISTSQRPFAYEGSVNSALYTDDGVSIYDVYFLFANKRDKIRNDFIKSFGTWKELLQYVKEMEDFEIGMMVNLIKTYQGGIFSLISELKSHEKPKEEVDLVFSTGHKSKGLEYEQVHVMEDFISRRKVWEFKKKLLPTYPAEKAKRKLQSFFEEINLLYVAATRTMREVYILGDIPRGDQDDPDSDFEEETINKSTRREL